jgi:protein SCO1
LMEASAGKIGSPIARLLLLCYEYDPASGRYTLAIVSLLRVLGVATALALGSYMLVMFRREVRVRSLAAASPAEPIDPIHRDEPRG